MSWMDSWSRPSKHAATPPPLYLTRGDTIPYCHSCGRIIGARKSQSMQEVKYCSTRCRNCKPGPIDRQIEAAFVAMLNGESSEGLHDDHENPMVMPRETRPKRKAKGDPRIMVDCADVETAVFGPRKDPEKVFGRKKNRAARGVQERPEDWKSVDMLDDPPAQPAGTNENDSGTASDVGFVLEEGKDNSGLLLDPTKTFGGGKVRPSQEKSAVNGSVGGEKGWAERIEETEEMRLKRLEGKKRADEREMVRKAARRGCAFGFIVPQESDRGKLKGTALPPMEYRRKCEAIMKGAVVEASFAKGEWGIRWRENIERSNQRLPPLN